MSENENNTNDTLISSPVPKPSSKSTGAVSELLQFVIIAILIVVPIRWFVAQPFIVSGASMEDTFHDSEYLIVDQLTYRFSDPARGDVIIFRYPNDHTKFFIKRIIGLPGETVDINGDRVTIINKDHPDGFVLDEPYRADMEGPNDETLTLGEHEYFVMGDNRDHSSDSRSWGVLRRDEIVGRAWLRLLPPNRLSILPGDSEQQ